MSIICSDTVSTYWFRIINSDIILECHNKVIGFEKIKFVCQQKGEKYLKEVLKQFIQKRMKAVFFIRQLNAFLHSGESCTFSQIICYSYRMRTTVEAMRKQCK